MQVLKGYRFRIYPDPSQREFFIKTFGCVRFTYNSLLKERQTVEESGNAKLTPALLKKDYPFLKETDSLALANAQRNLDRAFKNFFSGRAGYPKLKKKNATWQSYTTNNQKHTIYFKDGKLKLPKLKSLLVVNQHREIKGLIKSAIISAKKSEEFYISILCLEDVLPLKKTNEKIEIAFCPHTLVETAGLPPAALADQQKTVEKLAKAKRKLSIRAKAAKKRKVLLKDANNYQRQKQLVIRLSGTRKNQKRDLIDQLSWELVSNYDAIVVAAEPETIDSEALFSLSDWHLFLQKLQYKAKWYDKQLTVMDEKKRMPRKLQG